MGFINQNYLLRNKYYPAINNILVNYRDIQYHKNSCETTIL